MTLKDYHNKNIYYKLFENWLIKPKDLNEKKIFTHTDYIYLSRINSKTLFWSTN